MDIAKNCDNYMTWFIFSCMCMYVKGHIYIWSIRIILFLITGIVFVVYILVAQI
jgi:hypothetical protein